MLSVANGNKILTALPQEELTNVRRHLEILQVEQSTKVDFSENGVTDTRFANTASCAPATVRTMEQQLESRFIESRS